MDTKIAELVEYLKGTVEGKCAIALAGAHAKGAADASSDIDIYVFAERAKPFEERKALLVEQRRQLRERMEDMRKSLDRLDQKIENYDRDLARKERELRGG